MAAPELERLIRIIVEEVAAAQAATPARCACHAVLFECFSRDESSYGYLGVDRDAFRGAGDAAMTLRRSPRD